MGRNGSNARQGLRVVRHRPALSAILAIALFYGASSEPIDRLWELHVLAITGVNLPPLATLNPVAWWGVISIAGLLLTVGALEVMHRYLDVENSRVVVRMLSLANWLGIASVVAFALAGSFGMAVAAFLVYGVARSIGGPIQDTWTNRQLETGVRATVFSMRSQVDAFGQVVSGPSMGFLATAPTVRAALTVAASLLVPPQGVYALVMRWSDNSGEAT